MDRKVNRVREKTSRSKSDSQILSKSGIKENTRHLQRKHNQVAGSKTGDRDFVKPFQNKLPMKQNWSVNVMVDAACLTKRKSKASLRRDDLAKAFRIDHRSSHLPILILPNQTQSAFCTTYCG